MRLDRGGFGFVTLTSLAALAAMAYCFSDIPIGSAVAGVGQDLLGMAEGAAGTDPVAVLSADGLWINSQPAAGALKGKVVLVNFWTYSCINSLRPLPYLRAWADKYKDQGLVVIGVHTPEFGFEKDVANVTRAVRDLGIDYPVRLDNRYATWKRFGNNGWPGFYFIDARGRIRGQRVGEGDYADSERLIQELLAEAGRPSLNSATSKVNGVGVEAPPDWSNLGSGEIYVGYDQTRNFVSPEGISRDRPRRYTLPQMLALNHWGFGGSWTVGGEFAQAGTGGTIAMRFHARDLHMVLGREAAALPVRFRVTIDGKVPGADHGTDVDADGYGTINENRLYQLVRQADTISDRTFQIEFLTPGVRGYSFTFG